MLSIILLIILLLYAHITPLARARERTIILYMFSDSGHMVSRDIQHHPAGQPARQLIMAAKSIEVLCGGYSCQFVEDLPKELQTECSICLHTVREPHLVDCCGYRFCKSCIDPLLSAKKCPLCNEHFRSVIPDKLLQRTLNQKLVYCTHKSEGCQWTGALSESEEHQLNCAWKPILCQFCKKFQAPDVELKKHQKSACPARLILCPNGCGTTLKNTNIKAHVETKCPQSVVCCEFANAGCLSMMRRRDLKAHLETAKDQHIIFLSDKVKVMEAEILKLKTENASKDQEIESLQKCVTDLNVTGVHSAIHESSRLLVTNFPTGTNQHMIKSHFGQFGRMKSVKWFAGDGIAILEFVLSSSVTRVFERHCSTGICLKGNRLNIISS